MARSGPAVGLLFRAAAPHGCKERRQSSASQRVKEGTAEMEGGAKGARGVLLRYIPPSPDSSSRGQLPPPPHPAKKLYSRAETFRHYILTFPSLLLFHTLISSIVGGKRWGPAPLSFCREVSGPVLEVPCLLPGRT